MKSSFQGLFVTGLLALGLSVATANPQGGQVAAGSASINTVPGTVTINQLSNTAIINWQTFSISSGELTHFIQPSASSAVLNRVLSGQTVIDGTLTANGQVYLVNGNGIVIGPGGVVNAAGFTASTRDIADSDFLSGNLHFTGSSQGGVQSLGTINALGGDVVLIGKNVDNQGTINAPNGTAGLVAGDDVLLAQKNTDGSTIMVNPTTTAANPINPVGVHNSGTITSASAELKAANGNIYALAVQNEGTIRATTVQHQGGHIWLTSDAGTVVNSGTLDASATAAKGNGGTITLKSTNGTATQSGKIIARGGQGGVGGSADVSGQTIQFTGTVDLTAPGGTTGTLLIDPATLDVIIGGTDMIAEGMNEGTSSTIDPSVVDAALENADLILNADNGITISSALTWSSGSTLTLSTNNSGSTLNINAPITAQYGGLTISLAAATDMISTSSAGAINVNFFYLTSGFWYQNSPALPAFSGGNDFEIQGASTFVRATGGDGSAGNPLQITDEWGLQGLASVTANLAADQAFGDPIAGESAVLENNIDASLAGSWYGETGFVPIGTVGTPYTGTFNGNNYFIGNLVVAGNFTDLNYVGVFGVSSGTIENVGVLNPSMNGNNYVGGLVGYNNSMGVIKNSYVGSGVTASIVGNSDIGGLAGENDGTIQNSYSTVAVSPNDGSMNTGGLVGVNSGTIVNSFSTSPITFATGMGDSDVGGLVGTNNIGGSITDSYSTGLVELGTNGAGTGVGGLVGLNQGTISTSYSTSQVDGGSDGTDVGGLVGENDATIETCYSTGAVTVSGGTVLGGLVGYNNGLGTAPFVPATVLNSYWNSDANPTLSSADSSSPGTLTNVQGESLAQLMTQATFQPTGTTGAPNWDFTNDWVMIDGQTTPLLRSLSSTISGTTFSDNGITPVLSGDPVVLYVNGIGVSTTTSSGTTGGYSFLVSADQAVGGLLLVDQNQASNTFYSSGPTINPAVSGVDLWANTLRIVGTGVATNTMLATAVHGVDTSNGIVYTASLDGNSGGYDLDIPTGNVEVEAPFNFDGNISVDAGTFTTTATGPLTLTNLVFGTSFGVTTTNGDITLGGSIYAGGFFSLTTNSNIYLQGAITGPAGGGVVLSANAMITDTAAVNVDSFQLESGTWQQLVEDTTNVGTGNIVGSLPAFSVNTNFELDGGTFLRAAGGNGGTTTPYLITDVYGLQGLGSPSGNLYGANAQLANNIDASTTGTWNSGDGFTPIGDVEPMTGYTGTFNGANFAINGLTMDQADSPTNIGLFGVSSGMIENVVLTNINIGAGMFGGSYMGGLVGTNNGTVQNCVASGTVTAGSDGIQNGGLVGVNNGLVTLSSSAVVVSGSTQVGGLVGLNSSNGTISESGSTGPVVGNGTQPTMSMGGLVGENDGIVQSSYSTGTVTASAGSSNVGGLVGDNTNLVETSYSTGAVTGSSQVGGLVGENSGGATVMVSYSLAMVTGMAGGDSIGGLVGENDGTVETTYSTGAVNGGSTNVGAFVGLNTGTATNSYWNSDANSTLASSGGNTGALNNVNGESLAQLMTQTTFQPAGTGAPNWDFTPGTGDWVMIEGQTTPLLQNLSSAISGTTFSDSGSTPVGDDPVVLFSNGINVGTTMSSTGGAFSFLIPADELEHGVLLVDPDQAGNTFYSSGPMLSAAVSGVDLWANTLRIVGTGVATNTMLAQAAGGMGAPVGIVYTAGMNATGGFDLDIPSGNVEVEAPLSLDGNISVDEGSFTTTATAPLTQSNLSAPLGITASGDITLGGPATVSGFLSLTTNSNINLQGAITGPSGGGLILNGTGATSTITDTAALAVDSFILQGGTWQQLVEDSSNAGTGNIMGSLPAFSVGTDFELNLDGGIFLRAAGGNGSTTAPYQITDVYGLQGLGSMLSANAELVNNIDATTTGTWNGGSGFFPIGSSDLGYSGTFNGQNFAINGLIMNQVANPFNIGLFGVSTGTIENVALTNINITGLNHMGGLVGTNYGTVQTGLASGTLTALNGGIEDGGLVGENDGLVTMSSSTVVVSGGTEVGGLVGLNKSGATVSLSSSAGPVTGNGTQATQSMGGLVGENEGTVQTSSSTATVTGSAGSTNIGGLVGDNTNLVEDSFSAGSVTGANQVGGLVGENSGTVMDTYSTAMVTGFGGGDSVGGLVGENDNLVETSYSTGVVSAPTSTNVGGLIGNNTSTVTASFWATDTSGQMNSSGGIPATAAQLSDYNFFFNEEVVGTMPGMWDFTLGTGAWGVDVVGPGGPINGGLPVLQFTVPIVAQVQALSQTVVYGQPPNLTDFDVVQGSIAAALPGGPTLTIVGGNTDVGSSNVIQISGTPAPPFAVEYINGTETFSPAPLTITGTVVANKVYDTTISATLSSIGTLNGVVPGDTVTIDTTELLADFATKDVGNNISVNVLGLALAGASANNYTLTQPTGLTANITPATLTITGATVAATKVYDATTTDALTAFGTLSGVLPGDTVTLDTTAAAANFASKNVGNNLAVTVTGYAAGGADGGNYTVTQPSGFTADITPATLTITGATVAATKVYDATTTDALTAFGTLSGVIPGDTVTLNTTAAAANFATKDVGNNLAVTVNGYTTGGADAGNYTLTQPSGFTADITPATLTITGATVAGTKVYDATTTDALTAFGTLSGVIPGDNVTLDTTAAAANFPSKNVGNNLAVTVSGYATGGTDAGNYTLTQPSGFTADITPAILTITGATVAGTKVYDATTTDALTAFGTLNGVIPGDTVTLNTTAAVANFATKDVGNNLAVTVTGYAAGGADGGNYTVTQPSGFTADITPATLTITGATVAGTKVYDATTTDALTAFGTLSGVIPGDTVTLNTTAAANFATKDVGNNLAVTVNGYTTGGADAGNYTLTQPSGFTADITPATLTITGATVAATKVYDATTTDALTAFGTLSGVIPGDNVTLDTTAAAANFPSKNVGNNLAVTVSGYATGGADAGNYTLTQPSGFTADITPATLTITGATVAGTKVYDATTTDALTAFGTLSGVLPGDTVTLDTTAAAANFASKNVGNNLAVTVTGYAAGGADGGNYTVTQPSGFTADITPATLTITGATVAATKVYDATTTDALTAFGTLSGVIPGDTVTLNTTAAAANFATKDVGNNLAVTVNGYTTGGADAGNYTVTQPSGFTADITPATLTITGATVAATKVYDATTTDALTAFGTLSGILPGDTVTLNTAGAAANFPSKNVGNNLAVTVSGYATGGADAGNYTLTQPSGFTADITPATLTITGATVAGTKVYDATTTDALTAFGTLSGILPGDTVTLDTTAAAANFPSKNVGNNLAVTVSGYATGGADAGNYTLTQPSGFTADITPATLTITGATVAATKVYDATTTDALTAFGTLSGVIPGDNVTLDTTAAAANFASKNVGNNLAVTVNGYTTGGADAGNYTVTQPSGFTADITPATLTITGATVAATKVYDATTTDALTAFGTLSGVIPGDNVTLDTTAAAANFPSKNVGNNLAVTVSGYATGGADAGNYTLTQPSGFTADITPATLTITGATVAGTKVYDATTTDALTAFGTLSGVLPGDTVTLDTTAAAANFASKNVGNNLAVTVTGYAAGGADGGNYTVTQPSGFTADITPATLTVTGAVAGNKTYDGTTADTLSNFGTLNGVIPGDTVTINSAASSANFATANVGTNLAVTVAGYALGGADGGNYTVISPTGLTANITPAPLSITANNAVKVYDGTAYSGGNGVTYNGFVNGETSAVLGGALTYGGSSQGAINVGNYLITPGGLTSGNYALTFNSGNLDITSATVPPIVPVFPPQTISLIASVIASVTNFPVQTTVGIDLVPPSLGVAIVFADDLSGASGAINDGGQDPSTYLAFGSSTEESGAPTFYRLLLGGAGTSVVTNGLVSWVQPPADILTEFEDIFAAKIQNELQLAALTGKFISSASGSIPGTPPYLLLLTPGGGTVVISDGDVNPGQPPALVVREFDTIFSADLQNQLHNALFGSR